MAPLSYVVLLSLLPVVVCTWWLRRRRNNPKNLPYPPGPRGLPLIGNIFDLPNQHQWLVMEQWGKKYGDVIYAEAFGQPTLFLNSYEASADLLDKRSANYSDRPHFPMMLDVMGWGWLLTFIPYGERFRKHRWFLHQFLSLKASNDYQDLQTKEAHKMLQHFLESPNDYDKHVRRNAGSVIMMAAYGHEVADRDDEFITIAEEAMSSFAEGGIHGTFLIDFVPWLKYVPEWFPGAEFKRKGKEWFKQSRRMVEKPFEITKDRIRRGVALPSMMSHLMESCTNDDGVVEDEDIIAGALGVAYAGGSDTTVSSINSFILACILYPEILKKGHEELDRVVGRGRLPTFEDRSSLPYIEAIAIEVQRWQPVVPFCPAHYSMEDDEYRGYFIPKGTIVVANQWAILRDEKMYPNPAAFIPERWIPAKGKTIPRHPANGSFGFGRRKCPGRFFADNSIFITVATVLASFDITNAVDEKGKPIIPSAQYKSGLISGPDYFPCRITPRSPEVVQLIKKANEALA